MPRATEHIKEMVHLVQKLERKGFAYKGEDGSYYYDISKFKKYGKLANIKVKELKSGARVSQDEYTKDNASDFVLWKAYDADDGQVYWSTDLGKGRPGWHLECSAMSMKYLGEQFDIHTGGKDLIFPHHQNEIAQSEGVTGKQFVKYWMHNEYILVDGKKMSKSLGNFYTLRDLLDKGYDPIAIRYLLLSAHYRMPLNFTLSGVDASKKALQRLLDFMLHLDSCDGAYSGQVEKLVQKMKEGFEKAMDDDLNVSKALAAVFDFVSAVYKLEINKEEANMAKEAMQNVDEVLGVLDGGEIIVDEKIMELISKREEARKNKDFKEADRIRDELADMGIILEDSDKGVRWKKKK